MYYVVNYAPPMGVTKDPDSRKDKTIQIRVTEDQYDLIKRAADAAHLELSAFVRQLVLFTAHKREQAAASVQVFPEGSGTPGKAKAATRPSKLKGRKTK
jgi:hypothetical protein